MSLNGIYTSKKKRMQFEKELRSSHFKLGNDSQTLTSTLTEAYPKYEVSPVKIHRSKASNVYLGRSQSNPRSISHSDFSHKILKTANEAAKIDTNKHNFKLGFENSEAASTYTLLGQKHEMPKVMNTKGKCENVSSFVFGTDKREYKSTNNSCYDMKRASTHNAAETRLYHYNQHYRLGNDKAEADTSKQSLNEQDLFIARQKNYHHVYSKSSINLGNASDSYKTTLLNDFRETQPSRPADTSKQSRDLYSTHFSVGFYNGGMKKTELDYSPVKVTYSSEDRKRNRSLNRTSNFELGTCANKFESVYKKQFLPSDSVSKLDYIIHKPTINLGTMSNSMKTQYSNDFLKKAPEPPQEIIKRNEEDHVVISHNTKLNYDTSTSKLGRYPQPAEPRKMALTNGQRNQSFIYLGASKSELSTTSSIDFKSRYSPPPVSCKQQDHLPLNQRGEYKTVHKQMHQWVQPICED
jgi:hypothetical protein